MSDNIYVSDNNNSGIKVTFLESVDYDLVPEYIKKLLFEEQRLLGKNRQRNTSGEKGMGKRGLSIFSYNATLYRQGLDAWKKAYSGDYYLIDKWIVENPTIINTSNSDMEIYLKSISYSGNSEGEGEYTIVVGSEGFSDTTYVLSKVESVAVSMFLFDTIIKKINGIGMKKDKSVGIGSALGVTIE